MEAIYRFGLTVIAAAAAVVITAYVMDTVLDLLRVPKSAPGSAIVNSNHDQVIPSQPGTPGKPDSSGTAAGDVKRHSESVPVSGTQSQTGASDEDPSGPKTVEPAGDAADGKSQKEIGKSPQKVLGSVDKDRVLGLPGLEARLKAIEERLLASDGRMENIAAEWAKRSTKEVAEILVRDHAEVLRGPVKKPTPGAGDVEEKSAGSPEFGPSGIGIERTIADIARDLDAVSGRLTNFENVWVRQTAEQITKVLIRDHPDLFRRAVTREIDPKSSTEISPARPRNPAGNKAKPEKPESIASTSKPVLAGKRTANRVTLLEMQVTNLVKRLARHERAVRRSANRDPQQTKAVVKPRVKRRPTKTKVPARIQPRSKVNTPIRRRARKQASDQQRRPVPVPMVKPHRLTDPKPALLDAGRSLRPAGWTFARRYGVAGPTATARRCVEPPPPGRSIMVKLQHGDAICVKGVPYVTLSGSLGCSFIALTLHGREMDSVRAGGSRTFVANGWRITVQPGCGRHNGHYVYQTRISRH